MSEPVKCWLSKYALSSGIRETEMWDDGDGWMRERVSYTSWKLGRDVHLTRAGAAVAAEDQRTKKLASLRKQIAKLEKLTFGAGE